ncbi:thiamine pyrophosphate-dependent dehydrogenase E1 component subunit alpha [Cyanobium sp. HWJ4-Hawea]|uniref:thiamine pyrophosphate-dependent dehydrogenase E1 component subunit alpha n=1 Tax=Cyanobium sp. HWJ4-Hawea TaxID=2823713 RepID=UPI0020CB6FB5|nr:thiamine pyrophosphate-dependent dehydrogenase E1 component subunit alpha [Cyanobium sp. HWJ4-Hawea]MCP9808492.1 thiamine pyrophosphate-dependent dehydrogenase E1 component subunit alpha [Cyanobium sp. HWJ4-Hawea]
MKSPIDVFGQLLLLRLAEEELAKLFIEQRIFSFVHFYVGQEAVATGVSNSLLSGDRVLGNHRSHGHYLAKGGSLRRMICEILGKAEGCSGGKGGSMHMIDRSQGFMGSSPILGSITSIAAGSSFVQKHNQSHNVTVAYIGDGASEEGGFYETLNISALFKLPLMIVIENNLYSVNSTILDRRSPDFSTEAIVRGFGVSYLKADGNDYFDVYAKSCELLVGVRQGSPAVLECEVFRHMAHSSPLFDDIQGYRKVDLPAVRQEMDCINSLRSLLILEGFSEESLFAVQSRVRELVLREISYASSAIDPNPEDLYSDLYD